jgi:hypothetical protein
MSKNEQIVLDMIENGTLTPEKFKQYQEKVKAKQAEHERQRKETAERRQAWQREQMKPEVFVPIQAQSIHVIENRMDFEKLCATCDLPALKNYTLELADGKHIADFKGKNTVPIVQFLLAQIEKRVGATAKPEQVCPDAHADKPEKQATQPKPEYAI